MGSPKYKLQITLPPGTLESESVSAFLHEFFAGNFFEPIKMGKMEFNKKANSDNLDEIVAEYQTNEGLVDILGGNEDCLYIHPNRFANRNLVGNIEFQYNASGLNESAELHEFVFRMMKHLNSPFCFNDKMQVYRDTLITLVQKELYAEEKVRVLGSVKNGITHTYWRMWFGKDYTHFFGKEVLRNAPAYKVDFLDDDITFVQVTEHIDAWETIEGKEAYKKFAKFVGPDTFFDVDDPDKVLKAPDFSHLFK